MKISKLDAATRQLDVAIDLFLSKKDPLAVITLAGAAEEILGVLVKNSGKANMVDALKDLDKKVTGGRDFKILNNEINGLRNALKHANNPDEDFIDFDEDAPVAYLMRAIVNYNKLGLMLTENMKLVYLEAKNLQSESI
jgi:hypothetical protein